MNTPNIKNRSRIMDLAESCAVSPVTLADDCQALGLAELESGIEAERRQWKVKNLHAGLLYADELAYALGCSRTQVYAMRELGFPMPAGLATLPEAVSWIDETDFSMKKYWKQWVPSAAQHANAARISLTLRAREIAKREGSAA